MALNGREFALVEVAGYLPSRVLGKAVHKQVSYQRGTLLQNGQGWVGVLGEAVHCRSLALVKPPCCRADSGEAACAGL